MLIQPTQKAARLISGVRDVNMIDDTIISLFEKFSDKNGFEYCKESLPYRPYGEIKGTIDDGPFKIYIYQSESQASRRLHTIFTMPGLDTLPVGFCIEHFGDPHIKNKSFDELIQIGSYNSEIVTKYLNDSKKNFLLNVFNEIHKIESSLFKLRCSFRISNEEITLSVGRLFQDFKELTKAYLSVLPLLNTVVKKLPTLSEL
jgi:hypothetical protein